MRSLLTIYFFRRKETIELKLPDKNVLRNALSAANLPLTVLILCYPEPQAFSIAHPITVMKVPRIIS
jgi:hypothetical protein